MRFNVSQTKVFSITRKERSDKAIYCLHTRKIALLRVHKTTRIKLKRVPFFQVFIKRAGLIMPAPAFKHLYPKPSMLYDFSPIQIKEPAVIRKFKAIYNFFQQMKKS